MGEENRVNAAADRAGWDVGIYYKYIVRRVHDPEGKHDRCKYFVLDLTHDKFAAAAARAYADACESEFPALAQDLRALALREDEGSK